MSSFHLPTNDASGYDARTVIFSLARQYGFIVGTFVPVMMLYNLFQLGPRAQLQETPAVEQHIEVEEAGGPTFEPTGMVAVARGVMVNRGVSARPPSSNAYDQHGVARHHASGGLG
jgi:hypothetical protein